MDYKLIKRVKDDATIRNSFIDLALKTFDLSFENWYQNGFWTNTYIPYALADNDKVIANASVNVMNTIWQGESKIYIQIGTVMTDTAYRNQGLARYLIEEIISDWKERSNAIYLHANETVLLFYPKFGFKREVEYQYIMPIQSALGGFQILDMELDASRKLLKCCYQKSNPYSDLPMNDNYGLLMFYCASFMKYCVYYSKKYDAACIAMQKNNTLICYDIFCKQSFAMDTLLAEVAAPGTQHVIFGFTPKDTNNCECVRVDGEDILFVLSDKDNIFADNKVLLPLLSHA